MDESTIIITAIDCFYIGMVILIVSGLIYMETQIHTLKTMMEEHIKFDKKMCETVVKLEDESEEDKLAKTL